jgi:hypothetical protein
VHIAMERADFLGNAKVNGNSPALNLNLCHGSYPCLQRPFNPEPQQGIQAAAKKTSLGVL